MRSGYTECACRDCFEIVVSNDMEHPDFCDGCTEAGCEDDSECRRDLDDSEAESNDYSDSEPANVFARCVAAGIDAEHMLRLAQIISVAHMDNDIWAGCRVVNKCLGLNLAPYLDGPRFADYVVSNTGEIPGYEALRNAAHEYLDSL